MQRLHLLIALPVPPAFCKAASRVVKPSWYQLYGGLLLLTPPFFFTCRQAERWITTTEYLYSFSVYNG